MVDKMTRKSNLTQNKTPAQRWLQSAVGLSLSLFLFHCAPPSAVSHSQVSAVQPATQASPLQTESPLNISHVQTQTRVEVQGQILMPSGISAESVQSDLLVPSGILMPSGFRTLSQTQETAMALNFQISATEAATGLQLQKSQSDAQGHYRIAGLPAETLIHLEATSVNNPKLRLHAFVQVGAQQAQGFRRNLTLESTASFLLAQSAQDSSVEINPINIQNHPALSDLRQDVSLRLKTQLGQKKIEKLEDLYEDTGLLIFEMKRILREHPDLKTGQDRSDSALESETENAASSAQNAAGLDASLELNTSEQLKETVNQVDDTVDELADDLAQTGHDIVDEASSEFQEAAENTGETLNHTLSETEENVDKTLNTLSPSDSDDEDENGETVSTNLNAELSVESALEPVSTTLSVLDDEPGLESGLESGLEHNSGFKTEMNCGTLSDGITFIPCA